MTEQSTQAPLQPTPAAPQRQVLPISFLATKDVLPRRYVVHKSTTICEACKTAHHSATVYAFNEMMSRTGAGKLVMHLVPVQKLEYNLPIEVIALPTRTVPLCHECVGITDISHLPDPRGTDEWRRIYAVAQAPEFTTRKPKAAQRSTPKTIDDLLF